MLLVRRGTPSGFLVLSFRDKSTLCNLEPLNVQDATPYLCACPKDISLDLLRLELWLVDVEDGLNGGEYRREECAPNQLFCSCLGINTV